MSLVSGRFTDLRYRAHQSAWTRGRVAHGSDRAPEGAHA
ncbi:hypothetical protein ABH941_004405 [Streptacidiphilus sp. EB103A]